MSVKFRVSDADMDHVSYGDEHFPVDDEGFVLIPDHLAAMFASARPDWERIEEPSTVPAAGDTASVTSGIMQASDEATSATALGERAILEHEGNIAAQEALGLDAEDMQAVTGDTGVTYSPEAAEDDEAAEEDEDAPEEDEDAGTGAMGSITDTGQVNPGEEANTQSGTDPSTLRNAETSNPENAVNLGETNPPPGSLPETPPPPPDDTDQPRATRSKR